MTDKAKVLLIEDDELTISAVEGYLASTAVVTVARSKASACAALNDDFRLVISELSIPSQDGSFDAVVDNGIDVLTEVVVTTRCTAIFVFSGQIDSAQFVPPINDKADVDLRVFRKSEMPEMLKAATQTCREPQAAVKEWERHPPFDRDVVTVRHPPRRATEPCPLRAIDLSLHELVVPVCRWTGKWMDWADNEVVFGWSTARWHNHIGTEGGCLLIPRSEWGPTDPEFVRCPTVGCVTHHDWNWIDAVADMDPAALKEHGLNALVCDWINTGNRAANRIRDDHALFMAGTPP